MSLDYQARVDRAKFQACGHWRSILEACGVDASMLEKRNRPCPICGGKDRFSFTDKFGSGNYYCRGCGAGDGFDLIQKFLKCTFTEALARVESICGLPPLSPSRAPRRRRQSTHAVSPMLRLWSEAHPVKEGDAVWTYLKARGLKPELCGQEIRCHDAVPYCDESGEQVATYPAMLARVTNAEGRIVNIHRTYVSDGRKAPVAAQKKLMPGEIKGACVQLTQPETRLAIAEGIETALSVQEHERMPTWATLGVVNMKALEAIPERVSHVWIYADHDTNFAGQAGAYELAHKLAVRGIEVCVRVPQSCGDWLDVWSNEARP